MDPTLRILLAKTMQDTQRRTWNATATTLARNAVLDVTILFPSLMEGMDTQDTREQCEVYAHLLLGAD